MSELHFYFLEESASGNFHETCDKSTQNGQRKLCDKLPQKVNKKGFDHFGDHLRCQNWL